jgi:hypothetical protein
VFWKLNQGLLKEAPASEAHSVRSSGQSCRFVVQSRAADDPKPALQFHCDFVAVKHGMTACKFSGVVQR